MRFWIECTRFETGQAVHINIGLVGSMWRDGNRTVLAFVGGDARTIEVGETPEQVLERHFGGPGMACQRNG
ncbi:hypothetical protein [Bradyrhizobium sp.]|uniref:hypothetical protein n=1 Tax=Bradyrhizobium sp. TaxID=376 RepID=UPI004038004A